MTSGQHTNCMRQKKSITCPHQKREAYSHHNAIGGLLGQSEADLVVVCIPSGVVLAQEGVAQDPNWNTSIDTLDAKLAVFLALLILHTDDIEFWTQLEVLGACPALGEGERDDSH